MLLELIKNVPDKRLDIINSIIQSGKKVVLYGAGVGAKKLTVFLGQFGIEVEAYCVDDSYAKDGDTFMEKSIMALTKILNHADDYVMLIAWYNYARALEKIKEIRDFIEVYYIDDAYYNFKMDYAYFLQNYKYFEKTFVRLEDALSKEIFVAYLNAHISGDVDYLSSLQSDERYQYDYELLDLKEREQVMIDCGSYVGDTILNLIDFRGGYGGGVSVLAFEPDDNNIEKLYGNLSELQKHNKLIVVNKGVWSREDILKFDAGNGEASTIQTDTNNKHLIEVPVTTIDIEVKKHHLSDISFIKMDIEGSEWEALMGAKETILRDLPKIAVCVYHKKDDLFKIPAFFMSLENENIYFEFFLRQHFSSMSETVLYAIPKYK